MIDHTNASESEGEDYEPMTVEKLYHNILNKKKGGCGLFQWIMFLTLICGLCGFGYIEYIVSYLELIPQLSCDIPIVTDVGTTYEHVTSCSTEQVCMGETQPQIDFTYNYTDNKTSLHNWVEQLDLVCTPGFKLGLLGSMYFAGWSLTILVIPLMADKTGRRWWFTGCIVVTASTFIGFFLSKSLTVSIIMMFLVGASNSGRLMVGFVYGNEFLTPNWQIVFGTAFHFIDNSTSLIVSVYFDFINNHYLYISLVGFAMSIFCVIMMFAWMPESPLWQLKYGKIDEAQITIRRMMKMNGVEANNEIDALDYDIKELNRGQNMMVPNMEVAPNGRSIRESTTETGRRSILVATEDEQKSTMFYLRQRVVQKNLIVMAYMWATASFSYYMIVFYLKYLPGDIYSNTFASSGTDCCSVVFGGFLYKKFGIKKTFSFLLSFSVVGGLIIIFLGTSNESLMPIFVVITKVGISGSFVNVYISTVDVFPTLFCATALGFCNFFARVLTIAAPQVSEQDPPLPMIVLTTMCAIGIIVIQFVTPLKQQLIDQNDKNK